MYSMRRMTEGVGIENRDECSQWCDEHSSACATPFKISTTARRTVHTLIGSNDALSTRTRVFILKSKYSLTGTILSKVVGVKLLLIASPPGSPQSSGCTG